MSVIDLSIIVVFLGGLCVYGLLQSQKTKSTKDYFLGKGTTPWWVAMFSIVATETSVLTFISVPGLAYRGDWFFLQLGMGYIVGRILVSIFLIPQYFKSGVMSIYEVIGEKFGAIDFCLSLLFSAMIIGFVYGVAMPGIYYLNGYLGLDE